MKKNIITISRQFGSGGHSIAKAAAERMGIAFYDNQLITEVARQSGLSEEFIRENEEYASHSNSFLYQLAMSTAGSYGYPSVYQKLYEAQTKVIEELADKEPCLIVGRCADYILKDMPGVTNVFIYAETEDRLKRAVEEYGDNPEKIAHTVATIDKARQNYYNYHTCQKWGDYRNYNLSINSSYITEEEAESIRRWETSRYGQPEIVIVRKIPFAVFISIGAVLYTFARMLIR